jgi:hypothetical protein
MNAINAIVPTTVTSDATFHLAALTSSDSAASVAEYRLRMFVATGPCMTRNRIRIDVLPNAAVTSAAGSASVPALAIDAPRKPSHTVGTKMPRNVDQNTFRSGVSGRMKRV